MQRIVGVLALALALLLALPGVATASNDPLFPQQWALDAIGAETAWSRGRGGGTIIAVVDTGIDLDHEDLASKIVAGYDFIGGDSSPEDDARDCEPRQPGCNYGRGHGTHVAGIAAAATGNRTGVAGVAPDARIMPIRVLDSAGSGHVTQVAQGIRFAADNGADVINLSFGEIATDVDLSPAFTEAIRYAWARGSIPVVAAGNDFVGTSSFTDEPALVVTATGRTGGRAGYASSVGNARWGMAAPGGDGRVGSDEVCTPETGIVSTHADNNYACLVGTSMAVPHVAGAAAVLRGMGLSPQQVVDQLLTTTDDVGTIGRDTTFGAGRLNLARAAHSALPPTTVAPATVAAVPTTTPPTSEAPATTTTTEAPTTTVPSPTVSLPMGNPTPIEPPGRAIALLPDDVRGDDTTRYVAAVPAGLLIAGVGAATWRMRPRPSSPLR
ncbi:MAG: S8 family serine peptidase [Actinobacteria bacterium]|nr:S8 family serine peptidase [Actinomycetota bacterium]